MKKRVRRDMTDCDILVVIDYRKFRAKIENISRIGALITGLPASPADQAATFVILGHEVSGKIRWQKSGRTGVSFAQPLPENTFLRAHR